MKKTRKPPRAAKVTKAATEAALKSMAMTANTVLKSMTKGIKLVRQLVRVEKCQGEKVWLVVVGLDVRAVYEVSRFTFPKAFRKRLVKGYRFYAMVDMRSGAATGGLKIYPPFEHGGRPARTRMTEGKLLAQVQARKQNVERPVTVADVQVSLMADLIREDHEECNHDVGHCQHSDAFSLLYQLEQQEKRDPLNVTSDGVPPTLRPEEVKDAAADIQLVKEFVERVLYSVVGSAVVSSSSYSGDAINRLVRLQHLMWVAAARLGKSAA